MRHCKQHGQLKEQHFYWDGQSYRCRTCKRQTADNARHLLLPSYVRSKAAEYYEVKSKNLESWQIKATKKRILNFRKRIQSYYQLLKE